MTTFGVASYDSAAAETDGLALAVGAAARGDQAAFKRLYERYAASVYNLVLRSLRNTQAAEDACQEIWVKAYRELHRLDEPQAFAAWLYRIAARACLDAARKNRRFPATTELTDYGAPPAADDPERSALQRERVRLTWEALAALPARQHLALFLREIDRRSYKEIADILETSEAAVETLLFRARQSFTKAYERLDSALQERCQQAQKTMAALIDGEATPVQRRAVHAHLDACTPCSGELTRMQRAATAYAALAPLPVPALLGERILQALGFAGAAAPSTGIAGGITKLLALSAANAKIAAVSLVATGAVTAAAMTTPLSDTIVPGGEASPRAEHATDAPPSSASVAETQAGGGMSAAGAAIGVSGHDAPGVIPDPNSITDNVTSTVPNVDDTLADTTQTVDSLLHEVEATASEVAPILPLPEIPDIVPSPPPAELPVELPQAPALPTPPPLPTPPALPGLP